MSKRQRPARKLSSVFNFDPKFIDFVDVDLDDDLDLFVDPLLFWKSPHSEHHVVHAKVVYFFESAIIEIKSGNLKQAKAKFVFPEPNNLLGVSKRGHAGHGMSRELGGRVFNGIIQNDDILTNGLVFLNELQLVIEDVGPDLISDMTVDIAKDYFIKFTQDNCRRLGILMSKVAIDIFDHESQQWDEAVVELPLHPDTGDGILLTPKIVVRKRELSLNYKEVYKEHLRDIFKEKVQGQLEGLAKKPKVTWKMVKKDFPDQKSLVMETLRDHPELRVQISESIPRDIIRRGLEVTIENLHEISGENREIDREALLQIQKSLDKGPLKESFNSIIQNTSPLYFIDDLNDIISKTNKNMVVVLGSYKESQQDPFAEISLLLEKLNYEICIIKDMPDVEQVNPRQKLFTYAVLSRFLVVLDFGPSGHLNEIELLKDLTKPVAIISQDEKGSSYMTSGLEVSHTFFHRFPIDKFGSLENSLSIAVEWANDKIKEIQRYNKEKLPWMKS